MNLVGTQLHLLAGNRDSSSGHTWSNSGLAPGKPVTFPLQAKPKGLSSSAPRPLQAAQIVWGEGADRAPP